MRIQLKLRSFFFLVITLGLVAVTIFLGRVVYSDLYRKILLTFDQKLLSASTVVAAFVSGEDHREIVELTQLRGISIDRGRMYGQYAVAPEFAAIIPGGPTGPARALDPAPYWTADITVAEGMIYAATPEAAPESMPEGEDPAPAITSIDPATGKTGVLIFLDDACLGIGYLNGALYCAGEKLTRVPLKSGPAGELQPGEPEEISTLDSPLTGLSASADGKSLLATDTNNHRILVLNPEDGSVLEEVKLKTEDGSSTYPFGMFSIAYDELRRKHYGVSTSSLVEIDMQTGAVSEIPGAFGPRASQKTYADLVEPMIRVRKGSEITFLYSAILVNRETEILYALDSTQSDIHSNVGIPDSNLAEDDIRDVILKREIYLSDIEFWEDWGLLKSSYVPILDREGDAVAYAGADVNIDIIESRTRMALVQVLIIGVVALAVGLVIAYFITERLTRPIHELKQSALQVAAGGFGNEIHVANPRELSTLAGSLTLLSRSLQETVTSLTGENYKLEEKRRRNELVNLISGFMKHKSEINFFDAEKKRVIGFYEDPQYLAIWCIFESGDGLDSARMNSDLFRISRRLLQQKPDDYLDTMEEYLEEGLEFLVLIRKAASDLTYIGMVPAQIYPVTAEQKCQLHAVDAGRFELQGALKGLYLLNGAPGKDRSPGLQGQARSRIEEWKQEASPDTRILEVIL